MNDLKDRNEVIRILTQNGAIRGAKQSERDTQREGKHQSNYTLFRQSNTFNKSADENFQLL